MEFTTDIFKQFDRKWALLTADYLAVMNSRLISSISGYLSFAGYKGDCNV